MSATYGNLHAAHFTEAQVLDMRDRHAAGRVTSRELADEYEAPVPTIKAIIRGRSYKYVGGIPTEAPDGPMWPRAGFDLEDTDTPWADKANCIGVDPDLFFPERGDSTKEAKAICAGCEVRFECLEAAITRGEKHGIWGGLSERQRRGMRKARRIAQGG